MGNAREFEMTQTEQASAPESVSTEEPPKKEPFYLKVPETIWHWEPTEAFLTEKELFPDTAYTACLMYIYAKRGIIPRILLVRGNPNDPEKFTQLKGGARTRTDEWKAIIGRFYPFRYIDEEGKGLLDHHLLDTKIEECWEESGIDFSNVGEDIFQSLKRAPVAEYRDWSYRPPHRYHIVRVHFWVTPYFFKPNKEVWMKQRELTCARFFPLVGLPLKHGNGARNERGIIPRDENGNITDVGASMMFIHVKRLIEFLEHPKSESIRWQAGIPDDAGERIRARFPGYNIPRFTSAVGE